MTHRWPFLLKEAWLWNSLLREEEHSASGSLGLTGYPVIALRVLLSNSKMKKAFEPQGVGRIGGSWFTYCFSGGDVCIDVLMTT